MTKNKHTRVAARALSAALHTMDALCNARRVSVDELTEVEREIFTDVALIEAFTEQTQLADIWAGDILK
ncbi:hypothetical protein [Caballeronia arvi]|uniref:hypothetical protein n=1 Tax=Caballeronia arvi TaxID=1777135 RepID=UPI00077280C4|nr:hypothetical protein [Caballeronia arvi]